MIFRKRRSDAQKLYRQLLDELEPLNQKLKEEAGLPKYNRILLWDALLFNPAIRMYAEGLNCYVIRCFEASAIMCRNAIDSAIYLASNYLHPKSIINFKPRQISPQNRNNEWKWGVLRRYTNELGLLTESEIKHTEDVRKKGDFSAHFAETRDRSRREWETNEYLPITQKWRKENDSKTKQGLENLALIPMPTYHNYWKPCTSQEEALTTLAETKDILEKIINNYFISEKTLYHSKHVAETG